MAYRKRIFFNDKQKAENWDRWQRGESMSSIGRHFDRTSSPIYPLLERTGGIRPPALRRSRLALTLADREEISRGLIAHLSLRAMTRIAWVGRKPVQDGSWLDRMLKRKPKMLVAIALANNMARTIWAVLTKQEDYRDPAKTVAA